jgi:gamma-glutamyl:cysteine ligase YbdK (ATP-grasp superfamily)
METKVRTRTDRETVQAGNCKPLQYVVEEEFAVTLETELATVTAKLNRVTAERDTLKQQLEYVTELANLQTKCLNDVTNQRNKAQKQLDSYFADRDKSPWKSVDEPPKKRGEYLAVDKNGRYDVCYCDELKKWTNGIGYDADVTHWTEIPDLCL